MERCLAFGNQRRALLSVSADWKEDCLIIPYLLLFDYECFLVWCLLGYTGYRGFHHDTADTHEMRVILLFDSSNTTIPLVIWNDSDLSS